MDLVRHELRLNLLDVGNQGTVNVRQGDKDTHLLVVHLVKGSSPYLLPTDGSVIVVVCAEKPDGTFIVDSPASVVEGAVHYFMDEQFFTAPGIAKCELVVYSKNGEILYSPHFSTFTEKTSVDVEKVESKDEFRAFDQAMSDAKQITEKWSNPSASLTPAAKSDASVEIGEDGVHFDIQFNPDDFDVVGLPVGGSSGQVLRKNTGRNYDASWKTMTAADVNAVPTSRTVNGKKLDQNISFTPEELRAVPDTRKVNGQELANDITLTPEHIGAVPVSRTINDHPLTENLELTHEDVGAVSDKRTINRYSLKSNIVLDADDVKAVPLTRKINGKSLDTDVDLGPADVGAVPVTRKVNGKPLDANITLDFTDVFAAPGTLVADVEGIYGGLERQNKRILALEEKEVEINVDATPTQNSQNPVSSGGVYTELAGKVPTSRTINGKPLDKNVTLIFSDVAAAPGTLVADVEGIYGGLERQNQRIIALEEKEVEIDVDSTPTAGSENAVSSGGVYTELAGKVPTSRKINGKPLTGNVTLDFTDVFAAPGTLVSDVEGIHDGLERLVVRINNLEENGTGEVKFDSAPMEGSQNAVTSDGIYKAIQSLSNNDVPIVIVDPNPVSGSNNAVSSGGVYAELQGKVPTSRTINGKALDKNITLDFTSVGAAPGTIVSDVEGLYDGLADLNNKITAQKVVVDSAPTSGSNNAVSSGGVYTELQGKVPTSRKINGKALDKNITLDFTSVGAAPGTIVSDVEGLYDGLADLNNKITAQKVVVDSAPTSGSNNAVSSGGVYNALAGKVPTSRTINGKPLDKNVTLIFSDVAAAPGTLVADVEGIYGGLERQNQRIIALEEKEVEIDVDTTPTAESANPVSSGGVYTELAGKVPTSRKINGKPLTGNVTLDFTDVFAAPGTLVADVEGIYGGLERQNQRILALEEADIKIDIDASPEAGSVNPVSSGGVYTALEERVPTSRTVNGKALNADISLTHTDVGAAPASVSTQLLNVSSTVTGLVHAVNDLEDQIGAAGATALTKKDLLWENANPTGSFGEKSIYIGILDRYAFIEVLYCGDFLDMAWKSSGSVPVEQGHIFVMDTIGGGVGYTPYVQRRTGMIDGLYITFSKGSSANFGTTKMTEYGYACIPYRIYGIYLKEQ